MAKISHKSKRFLIVILNFGYLIATLTAFLILHEYIYDIYSDFSRFKIMHSSFDILRDTIGILLWVIFSIVVYKENKDLIFQDKEIIFYSILPFIVFLIFYYAVLKI